MTVALAMTAVSRRRRHPSFGLPSCSRHEWWQRALTAPEHWPRETRFPFRRADIRFYQSGCPCWNAGFVAIPHGYRRTLSAQTPLLRRGAEVRRCPKIIASGRNRRAVRAVYHRAIPGGGARLQQPLVCRDTPSIRFPPGHIQDSKEYQPRMHADGRRCRVLV
jgi:hypothetical protein